MSSNHSDYSGNLDFQAWFLPASFFYYPPLSLKILIVSIRVFCCNVNQTFCFLLDTPAQLQFKANVTNMSRVNFIWNSVDANNQTTYSIYCKNILSIYWKIVYIGLQTNCTVDNLEPFAKFYCEMEVCTRGVSKCEPRTDINVTFVNLAPGKSKI